MDKQPISPAVREPLVAFPAADDFHRSARLRCAKACGAYNALGLDATEEERTNAWNNIVNPAQSLTATPTDTIDPSHLIPAPMIKIPIIIDYGTRVTIDPTTFINRNCQIADTPHHPFTIGARCLIGPNVSIYAVTHPLDYRARAGRHGPSLAGPVTIEDDVWIGGGVSIMPGVTIHRGSVVGAGSVVTKSVPAFHLALGSPARVVRKVAVDVPDAEGLRYAGEGRVAVTGRGEVRDAVDAERVEARLPLLGRGESAQVVPALRRELVPTRFLDWWVLVGSMAVLVLGMAVGWWLREVSAE
ncbi:hypothetical protein M8818_000120 [Zalaria obscura]|uniref:Uncharacterized protein n=1 Tax=Zalaria obscura TaxID=2024903 RepID=A0ACC3SPP5_9PEZI